MNAVDDTLMPVLAWLDGEGRLVDADARLLDLVRRAGGDLGSPLPQPELAAVVRLARRLGIPIARAVMLADGADDLELWVVAEPARDGVQVTASGWSRRVAWRPDTAPDKRDNDFDVLEGDGQWDTDASLRLTHFALSAGEDSVNALGQPLTQAFALIEDENGGFPLFGAMTERVRFDSQRAILRATSQAVRLSGTPRIDDRGAFAGFIGTLHVIEDDADEEVGPGPQATAAFPDGFGAQLDRSLRGPLERIIAHASSMSAEVDGPLGETYTGYAGDIVTAGRHLLGMIADLADLDAIERADFVVEPEAIDLADIARRSAGLLSVRAAENEVRIERPSEGDSAPARGDFRRALQVLVNLVGNAVRYSPRGGVVWVRAELSGEGACVIVADQGKGIALADQARIFEKFGRVDPSEPGGSGLGLYISRRLARAMGGDITVDSAPGEGARFIFTLPIG